MTGMQLGMQVSKMRHATSIRHLLDSIGVGVATRLNVRVEM